MIKLGICVPTGGTVWSTFAYALAETLCILSLRGISSINEPHIQVGLMFREGSVIHDNREQLVNLVLENEFDYMLFIDDDMVFNHSAVESLFSRQKDVVLANYLKKAPEELWTAYQQDGSEVSSKGRVGIERVYMGGFGLCLIKVEALKRLKAPLFLPMYSDASKQYSTEDFTFFSHCHNEGIAVWLDHDASKYVGHIGKKIYAQRSN